MEKFVEKQQKMMEESSKHHIFDAVVRITQKYNKTDFTMQHIADEAGMAIGTLYNYFENKNELLFYVFRQLLVMNKERCNVVVLGPGNADTRLRLFIAAFLQFGREYIIIFRLFDRTGLHHKMPEGEREKNTEYNLEIIKNILDDGVKENLFRHMDTTMMAKILFTCMIGVAVTEPLLNQFSPEQLSEELMHLFDLQ
jgi:TetR/AcrR family transcriptional regulator, fatty acid metabolism regulator protein